MHNAFKNIGCKQFGNHEIRIMTKNYRKLNNEGKLAMQSNNSGKK